MVIVCLKAGPEYRFAIFIFQVTGSNPGSGTISFLDLFFSMMFRGHLVAVRATQALILMFGQLLWMHCVALVKGFHLGQIGHNLDQNSESNGCFRLRTQMFSTVFGIRILSLICIRIRPAVEISEGPLRFRCPTCIKSSWIKLIN